mmetsp:Transcript_12712/g.31725  ORF Transcript_12712/g.31725 Transcript_12712/m.31725 type:complete len:81 (+) Transcript_12712:1399-1641(+)
MRTVRTRLIECSLPDGDGYDLSEKVKGRKCYEVYYTMVILKIFNQMREKPPSYVLEVAPQMLQSAAQPQPQDQEPLPMSQ